MTPLDRPVALGETLPDVRLGTFDGSELPLSSLRGQPVVVVCVRYYG
jgi:peroxiredoxin